MIEDPRLRRAEQRVADEPGPGPISMTWESPPRGRLAEASKIDLEITESAIRKC